MKYTEASHNMLFRLDPARWGQDLDKSQKADITRYQEAEKEALTKTLRKKCAEHGHDLFDPNAAGGNPVSWKRSVFRQTQVDGKAFAGTRQVHLGAKTMGIDIKYNPPRHFTYVGLTHIASGKNILVLNIHPIASATKRESASDPRFRGAAQNTWADWAIAQYTLDVVAFTAKEMSRQEFGTKTIASFWDVISLGGDYNASLSNTRRWYYPGSLLSGLYLPDSKYQSGLDHLQVTKGSDVKTVKRWAVKAHTDHNIHFVERQFANVTDFPRDL